MPAKKYGYSETKYKRWIKEGRGSGSHQEYKPWLTVRDVPSEGRSHRIFSFKSQRIHHLLSDLEAAVFLILDWNQDILDIREQFPLQRETTLEVADRIGAKHPKEKSLNLYMSSDFLVDTNDPGLPKYALQAKYESALCDQRTTEKLEIEEAYWIEKDIPWFVVTENEVPKTVLTNIKWLAPAQSDEVDDEVLLERMDFYDSQFCKNAHLKIIDICKKLDNAYDLDPGESLLEVRQLLAKRFFYFDVFTPTYKLVGGDLTMNEIGIVERALHVSNQ